MNDKLLHGKSDIRRIVGIECNDDKTELFIQDEAGTVTSVLKPNHYWILGNHAIDKGFQKLDGNLHYKWGKQYTKKADFQVDKQRFRSDNQDVYLVNNAEEAAMIKDGYTFYRDMQPKELSLLSFDLETTGLDGEAKDAKVLLISTTYREKSAVDISGYSMTNELFRYDEYDNEADLISDFCRYVQYRNPSLIIGHNIISYDFPYLQARAKANKIELPLGRDGSSLKWGHPNYKAKFRLDGTRNLEYRTVSIYGREIVDTYFLAVSFDVSKSLESYGLKPLIKQLGFEKEGRQYYDAGSIRDKYTDLVEWAKICQYAIEDAEDAVKLWDYMGPLYFHLCPNIPKPLSEILLTASGSKINALMVRAYLQDAHSIPKADMMEKYEGAVSFSVPGIYRNCFKIDLAALYPSIMIEYEIYDKKKDPKGYLLELVKIFRAKRLEYKRLAAETGLPLWKEMDTTAKSVLNSFYGFCGASGLNFNSLECAALITETGREILEYTIKYFSGKELKEFVPEVEEEDEIA